MEVVNYMVAGGFIGIIPLMFISMLLEGNNFEKLEKVVDFLLVIFMVICILGIFIGLALKPTC